MIRRMTIPRFFRLPRLRPTLLALLFAAQAGSAGAAAEGFYRFPSLHGDDAYFIAEGDVWRADVGSGHAERITTHPDYELFPFVSPDGRWLAFLGPYEGVQDVYVMPASGGQPRRLTWDGRGLRLQGWTPQGEILFTAPPPTGLPDRTLYAVDPRSGVRRMLPVSQAADGALLADGRTLVYTRGGLRGDNARGYAGGARAAIWQVDTAGGDEAVPLLADAHNNLRVMPYGERIAFLSDRSGTMNLWSMRRDGSDLRPHTRHAEFDVRSASIDGMRVIYTLGADLWLVDLAVDGAEPRRLPIVLGGDFDQRRTRWVKRPQDFLTSVALAPDGERVVLSVRGRLATQGTGPLRRAELPVPPTARCREGSFSHDSRHVYALCDTSGESEVWRFPANGVGDAQQITRGARIDRAGLYPSPDGRHLAHTDRSGRLWLTELGGSPTTREIDRSRLDGEYQSVQWSPDGKAIALVRPDGVWARPQLLLHLVDERRTLALTSDRYESRSPAFTPDGKWLYFLSDRSFDVDGRAHPFGDRNTGPNFERRTKVYALALQPGLRFPFLPRDELAGQPGNGVTPPAAPASAVVNAPGVSVSVAVTPPPPPPAPKRPPGALPAIEPEGLAARLYEVPLGAGTYTELRTDGKRLYLLETDRNLLDRRAQTLRTLAIDDTQPGLEFFAAEVNEIDVTPDARKILVVRGTAGNVGDIFVFDPQPRYPNDASRALVRWLDWPMPVEPRDEWRQMFADAWRLHRDRYYDANMRGVDWAAQRRRFEPLVERVTDRGELGELLGQMVAALGTLHSNVVQNDLRQGADDIALASLGAVFGKVANGFRVERLYRGDPELPSEAGPLAAPNVGLQPGDVITAVNGRSLADAPDIGERLRGLAGKQVLIDVQSGGRAGSTRQAIVQPVDMRRDTRLRLTDWEFERARRTRAAGDNRIGYLHLRAMVREDIGQFVREFYSHVERDGLIVDVRGNGGGNIDSWVIEKLMRRAWAYWQPRNGGGLTATCSRASAATSWC